METRKIQQVGGGTYTVSLPKQWATAADIEPGVSVALHTHIDGTLVVQTATGDATSRAPLRLSVEGATPERIEHVLRAAYAAGMGTVGLDGGDELTDAQRRAVEGTTRELTGVTVTESTERTVQIRSLLDAEEVSITQSVRQLQFAALSAHREATAALTEPDAAPPREPDGGSTRLYRMVERYFQRGLDSLAVMDALGLTQPELFVRWVVARELDSVTDDAERIAQVARRVETPAEEPFAGEFAALAERARETVADAVAVVVDGGGLDVACQVHRDCTELQAELEALDRRLFEREGADYRLAHAVDALRRTVEHAAAIAELGVRERLRESRDADSPLEL